MICDLDSRAGAAVAAVRADLIFAQAPSSDHRPYQRQHVVDFPLAAGRSRRSRLGGSMLEFGGAGEYGAVRPLSAAGSSQ